MGEIFQMDNYPLSAKTGREKASYCIGLETGNSIRMQFEDLDIDLIHQGFEDAIRNRKPKVSPQDFQSTMTALRQQVEQQQKAYVSKMAQENKKAAEEFLTQNKENPAVQTLSSGLQYKVITSGVGESPSLSDIVKVHYEGTFLDGKVFDSSYQRNQPQVFPVNRVIPGWSEVLQLMKVGDKWEVFIPPYLAYGENGFPPHIEPNTMLVFKMELLGVNEE